MDSSSDNEPSSYFTQHNKTECKNSSEEFADYFMPTSYTESNLFPNIEQSYNMLCSQQKVKKQKSMHRNTEVVGKIINRDGKLVPIRVLLNTGTTATIILKDYVERGKASSYKNPKPTQWNTMGGNFITKRKA